MILYLSHMKCSFISPRRHSKTISLTFIKQIKDSLLDLTGYDFTCCFSPIGSIDFSPHHLHLQELFLKQRLYLHQLACYPLLLYPFEIVYRTLALFYHHIHHLIHLISYILKVVS